jgi:hypothetical protein
MRSAPVVSTLVADERDFSRFRTFLLSILAARLPTPQPTTATITLSLIATGSRNPAETIGMLLVAPLGGLEGPGTDEYDMHVELDELGDEVIALTAALLNHSSAILATGCGWPSARRTAANTARAVARVWSVGSMNGLWGVGGGARAGQT